mmetsp:Transcript_17424/g.52627  ORF Transcript_17424/g.52627 Transcript_17424/m.52627 type:complete len:325 (+) Transcript_17424:1222-2196(+)
MVPILVDEGPLVDLGPSKPTVTGHVGVGLVRLEAQVRPYVARAHDDAHGVLQGVEGGIVVEVCDAMKMKPTPIFRTVHLLACGVHLRRLQIGPDATLVEGDYRADHALRLRLALRRAPLFNLCALRVGLLELVRLLGRFGLLACGGRFAGSPSLGVTEVGHVDALEAENLVELAVARTAADVVLEGECVADTLLVRDVQVAHAGGSALDAMIYMQHHSALGRVQDGVGLLIDLLREPGRFEALPAVGTYHQLHSLACGVFELGHKEKAVRDQELVAHGHKRCDTPAGVGRVGKLYVLGPHGQLGLIPLPLGEVREVDAVLLLVG